MEKKGKVKVNPKFRMCEHPPTDHSKESTFAMGYNNNNNGQKNQKSHDSSIIPSKPNHVSAVMLFGVPIVSLVMDGKERLCLAQISSTLLKEFSYNEIHNRRVALGITCIQCTPVQLEILRRAGAMPVTSRRCGMITRREAERLCQSFLGDHAPPQLPENFAFDVYHECAWGCRGNFVPSRYNSSRAKCIRCSFCQLFFSPNKFIFHSHRLPDSRYVQPDAANFNSWRRHLRLCGDPPEDIQQQSPATQGQTTPHSFPNIQSKDTNNPPNISISDDVMATAQIVHAWEDVKAMFNGGTRKRLLAAHTFPSTPMKRNSPPKMSPVGSYGSNGDSSTSETTSSPQSTRQTPLQQLHAGNGQQIIRNSGIETGSSSSQNFISSVSGSTPPFLSPTGRIDGIWNPGISGDRNCPIEGSPIQNLPLAIHPLSIPWFRRPLFPFSHPFGPSCKYLADGTVIPETIQSSGINNSNRLPSSAFKPVVQQSNTTQHIFSTWLNNSGLHGNFISIPEDLSLGSTNTNNSSTLKSTDCPNFIQQNYTTNVGRLIGSKYDLKNPILITESLENRKNQNIIHNSNKPEKIRLEFDESSSESSNEENVDVVESTTDNEDDKEESSNKTLLSPYSSKKRSLDVIESDEVDVDSEDDDDVDVNIIEEEEPHNSIGQQEKNNIYSNNNHRNGLLSKRKKRLWDFDTRSNRLERTSD